MFARPLMESLLQTTPAEETLISDGSRKIGGLPDLPVEMAWDRRETELWRICQGTGQAHRADAAGLVSEASLQGSWRRRNKARRSAGNEPLWQRPWKLSFPGLHRPKLDLATMSLEPDVPNC